MLVNDQLDWTDPLGLDVTVTLFQGMAVNLFGRADISVNGGPEFGFETDQLALRSIRVGSDGGFPAP